MGSSRVLLLLQQAFLATLLLLLMSSLLDFTRYEHIVSSPIRAPNRHSKSGASGRTTYPRFFRAPASSTRRSVVSRVTQEKRVEFRTKDRRIIQSSKKDEVANKWAIPLLVNIGRFLEDLNGSEDFNEGNPYVNRPEYEPPLREVEQFEPVEVVQGRIPADMEPGFYFWNCPVANTWPPTHTTTNLCGHGMIHCINFAGNEGESTGEARFSSHVVRTPTNKIEREAKFNIWGRPGDLRSATGMVKLILSKFIYAPLWGIEAHEVGGANTNLIHFNNGLYALEEAMAPLKFSIDSETGEMRSDGCEDFQPGTWKYPMCAHPKLDRRTNQLMVTGYNPSLPSGEIKYGVYRDGKLENEFTFRFPSPAPIIPFMHDMAITERFTIVIDNSYEFSFPFNPSGIGSILEFNAKRPARLGIMPRMANNEGEITWINLGEPMVINHIANAWEDPEDPDVIILHAPIAKEGIDIFSHKGYFARMTELRIDLRTNTATKTDYSSGRSCEFPRVRDELAGYPSRFAYTVKHTPSRTDIGGLVKWDLFKRRLVKDIDFPPGVTGLVGEPQFVPKTTTSPHGDEDDGYVVAAVRDGNQERTLLYIYNAKDFSSEPIAVLAPPERLPFGLHGQWVSNAAMGIA